MRHLALLLALLNCIAFLQIARADDEPAKAKIDPVPAGWKISDFGMATVGENRTLAAHCQLTSEEKSPMSLEVWAKGLKGAVEKGNGFKEFKQSELKPGKYGGHDAFEYDYSGGVAGKRVHYRVFFLSVGNNFVMLECFTDPDHWDGAQKSFEELAKNVK